MKTAENLAKRYNNGKPQWSLVHYPSLEPMVRVLEFGAEKYDTDNWKKGLPIRKAVESLLRHTYAFLDGEDLDSESGLPHIGHMQANTMFLAHVMANHPKLDDRASTEQVTEQAIKGDSTNNSWSPDDNYIQPMQKSDPTEDIIEVQIKGWEEMKKTANSTIENLCTQYKNNDKVYTNLMGGHYVGNIESEESKSIIDSKV